LWNTSCYFVSRATENIFISNKFGVVCLNLRTCNNPQQIARLYKLNLKKDALDGLLNDITSWKEMQEET